MPAPKRGHFSAASTQGKGVECQSSKKNLPRERKNGKKQTLHLVVVSFSHFSSAEKGTKNVSLGFANFYSLFLYLQILQRSFSSSLSLLKRKRKKALSSFPHLCWKMGLLVRGTFPVERERKKEKNPPWGNLRACLISLPFFYRERENKRVHHFLYRQWENERERWKCQVQMWCNLPL